MGGNQIIFSYEMDQQWVKVGYIHSVDGQAPKAILFRGPTECLDPFPFLAPSSASDATELGGLQVPSRGTCGALQPEVQGRCPVETDGVAAVSFY